ncbi:MAG: outer membrane lipoprotein carrier protein LolA [Candidatus Paracaedibacteraceae bacterium]|nr:outer membrane lipoprotein carrier protein LolA [Candidatus Paracaedibacteraceae bacterium]
MISILRTMMATLGMIVATQAAVEPALIKKVEDYLNGIKTYRARILQTNNNGSIQKGWFYMERGGKKQFGKMRIEYEAPIKDLMIVDGREFIFYDGQAKEKNTYDIDATPAAFLLRRKIDLHNDLKIVDKAVDGNELGLKVIRSGDESGAALVLKFSTSPIFKLNGWAVIDPQGLMTRVHLEEVNIGMNLDANLFKYKD